MKSSTKNRKSNFELLRMVCMLLIVAHHYVIHGGFGNLEGGVFSAPILFLQSLLIGGGVGNNCFVLLAGYFLLDSNKSVRQIKKIWGTVLFYSVLFFVVFAAAGKTALSLSVVVKTMFPIISGAYWFASTYFFMFLFYPYLNRMIKAMKREEMQKLIGLCLFIWYLFPSVWELLPLDWKADFQSIPLLWFFTMYLIGAYLNLYGDSLKYGNKRLFAWGGVITVFVTIATMIAFDWLSANLGLFNNSALLFVKTNSITTALLSICIFMVFKNMDIGYSKIINRIASTTFGIYLIHDNEYVRSFLWKELLHNASYMDSMYLPLHTVVSVAGVFCVCMGVESVRTFVVKRCTGAWRNRMSGGTQL